MNALPQAPRSYLFVPGDRPERFAKAWASGADAVVFDLEDAVAPAHKEAARAALAASWAGFSGKHDGVQRVVRINDHASPWHEADLALLRSLGPCTVMLPKAESARVLAHVAGLLGPDYGLVALVESARGLLAVDEIAHAPGVARLAFGSIDYAADLGLSGDPRGLLYPASRIALAARAAMLPAPVAGVTTAFRDEAALREDLALARACGFGAKLCIHPCQVAPLHALLAPSERELDWARRVLAAAEGAAGAVQVDGAMVDRPVLLQARAILARAAASPSAPPAPHPTQTHH